MAAAPPAEDDSPTPRFERLARWVPALSGLITSVTLLLLFLSGNVDAIPAVAAFGAAVTGGTAASRR
ncbi:hypothetical protein [Streptomyces sp. NPDC127098]|uniref:hypothetical protein n=1 Tax=Streptomyces sp. NPDC127098 TaxID=3347137 RepID=UPI003649BB8F